MLSRISIAVPRVQYTVHGVFFFQRRNSPSWAQDASLLRFRITQRHTAFGTTLLDQGSVRRTELYLTIHNIHKRQTSTILAGFEPAIPASEGPQDYALDQQPPGSAFTDITIIFKFVDSLHCVIFVKWAVYAVNGNIGSLEVTDRLIN